MATKRLCKLCRQNPAQLPDRETMSPTKAVCRECHAARLRGDLIVIMHTPLPGQMELFKEKL
jgi:hypothetical protein